MTQQFGTLKKQDEYVYLLDSQWHWRGGQAGVIHKAIEITSYDFKYIHHFKRM